MEKDKIIEHIIEIVKEIHVCGRKKGNVTNLNDLFENYSNVLKRKENLVLELTENLNLIMPIDNNASITELMTYLYSIKKFKIELVDQILEEKSYEDQLIKFTQQMSNVIINDGKLAGISKEILAILFETNIIGFQPFTAKFDQNIRYIFINYINKMFLSGKDDFSYECISKVIENLTEVMGSVSGINNACYIVPSICLKDGNSSSLGVADEEIVYLNEEIVKDYYNKTSLCVFNTMFHELAHVNQNRRHEGLLPIIPQIDLKQMKESIIRKAYPEYYNLNYDIISIEKEANVLGNVCSERYLNSLGFSLKNNAQITMEIEEELKKYENELRQLDDGLYTVDELFLRIVNEKKDLFDKFSVLGLLYKEEDGIIKPLTDEEVKYNFEIKSRSRESIGVSSYDQNFEVLNYMVNRGDNVKNK